MGASVRARLLNLSKQRRQPFDLLLNNYVLERLLYRLSQTKHHDRFILKGAILLTKWFEDPLRPTRDLDFLAIGNDDQEEMVRIFQEVCAVSFNDGVVIDPDSVKVDRIREETEYGGLRITANAMIDNAKIRVVIDIAFGDSVEPGLQEIDLPVLLDFPAPHLRAYARETVIAEKFQAMVMLGRANSRPLAEAPTSKPQIGLTQFGVTTSCVDRVRAELGQDYECIVFHATGLGGQSMEKLADGGFLTGIVDITTTEVADFLLGGVLPCTEDRFGAVARTGLPYVGSCGALDMVNFEGDASIPSRYKGRLFSFPTCAAGAIQGPNGQASSKHFCPTQSN